MLFTINVVQHESLIKRKIIDRGNEIKGRLRSCHDSGMWVNEEMKSQVK